MKGRQRRIGRVVWLAGMVTASFGRRRRSSPSAAAAAAALALPRTTASGSTTARVVAAGGGGGGRRIPRTGAPSSPSKVNFLQQDFWSVRHRRASSSRDGGALSATRMDDQGRRLRSSSARRRDEDASSDGGRRIDHTDDGGWGWEDDGWEEVRPARNSRGNRSYERRHRLGDRRRRAGPEQGSSHHDRSDRWRRRRSQRDGQSYEKQQSKQQQPDRGRIDLKALEGAGFVHLYGLSCVKNALEAGRRDFSFEQENDDDDDDDDNRWDWDDEFQAPVFGDDDDEQEERAEEAKETRLKPEAQFRPWLFVQERLHGGSSSSSGRSRDKAELSVAIQELAEERGVPVAAVDKGVLNTLSGNRPHQGAVLRCGPLDVETISRIPPPGDGGRTPSLWLVLDEVVDPQNLGALIRSAHFLGGSEDARIGILVCTKNSAPLSAVVSAASAGALEVATLYATSNLPRTLSTAEQDGFRIVGASATSPQHGDEVPFYDLQDMPGRQQDSRPTLLVLGSEGHGLRHLVATHCTEFVRIPGAAVGVDSLNVSVTGGILLWHLLHGRSSA